MVSLEKEMARALGLDTSFKKATQIAKPSGGWYVKMAVRKVKNGCVEGVAQVFETIVPTISQIEGEYLAKKELGKKLKFWALLDSRPAEDADYA